MRTRVLFVCTGNTCRSPLAEGLLRREAGRRGMSVEVASAGTFAGGNQPASSLAIRVAGRRGVDLSGHRSRGLTRDLLTDVSLAVGMSDAHLQAVRHLAPDVPAVLATELLPDGDGRRGSPVPDPFGGDEEWYDEVADVLQSCVDGMLDRMSDE